ncbi:MAG: hypothetical protein H6831_07965 [Planctomycetes bacterium]|nr:hypothetical protein [Planctomycetota bacterium]MCB9904326.1 hypothetical protein [Planctomycetota bacterium]
MRLDPWKLAALVLFVACVDEVARPEVANAPGTDLQVPQVEASVPASAEPATTYEAPRLDPQRD